MAAVPTATPKVAAATTNEMAFTDWCIKPDRLDTTFGAADDDSRVATMGLPNALMLVGRAVPGCACDIRR